MRLPYQKYNNYIYFLGDFKNRENSLTSVGSNQFQGFDTLSYNASVTINDNDFEDVTNIS